MLNEALESVIMHARVLKQAQDKYEKAIRSYNVKVAYEKPLAEGLFWHITETFRTLIFQAITLDRAEPPEWAADELCRIANYPNTCPWWLKEEHKFYVPTFPEVLDYACTYDNYRTKAYKLVDAMKQIETGKGDDGFGDMMDSLPLLGHKFFRRMEKQKFYNYKHFKFIIRKTVREHVQALGKNYAYYEDKIVKKFSEMVIDGENYFGMMLDDKVKEWVPRYFTREEEEVVA